MRIVIATPFYPPEKGVLGMYAKGLEGAFERFGHEVTIVRFSAFLHLPPLVRHSAFGRALRRAAKGSDLIVALDTWSVGLPAMVVSKMTGVPLSLRIGGDFLWEAYVERTKQPVRLSDFYAEKRPLTFKERIIFIGIRALLKHTHSLFFNSQFQIGLWQPIYGFDRAKARVLENYFPVRTEDILPPQGKIFVSAGRHIALKNYDELLRAFKRVQTQNPDIELDTRSLPHAEHHKRLKTAYAVVIPSISEASSNTAIDAVVAGKPFIMTNDTGTGERLGDCGFFVDTRSEDELEQAIERVLDPTEYERLAARIRAFSFTHLWDDMAKEIIDAL